MGRRLNLWKSFFDTGNIQQNDSFQTDSYVQVSVLKVFQSYCELMKVSSSVGLSVFFILKLEKLPTTVASYPILDSRSLTPEWFDSNWMRTMALQPYFPELLSASRHLSRIGLMKLTTWLCIQSHDKILLLNKNDNF